MTNKIAITCMQHLQQQRHEDSIPQILPRYIVPSYGYHKDVAIFGKGSRQSKYSQCTSVNPKYSI